MQAKVGGFCAAPDAREEEGVRQCGVCPESGLLDGQGPLADGESTQKSLGCSLPNVVAFAFAPYPPGGGAG